jgi:hypothetical protein
MAEPVRTVGDVAREELARLGLDYFQDIEQRQRALLDGMGREQRTAFAAAAAERLLRAHEKLPPDQRRSYPLDWRGLLDAVWRGLAGDPRAFDDVAAALARFYLSPQHHSTWQEGPSDAGDDTVVAIYDAAECFLHGCTDFAVWAARRGVDAAGRVAAGDTAWWARRPAGVSELGWALAHPAHQGELARQMGDLQLLAERGQILGGDGGSHDEQRQRARLLERLRGRADTGP